MIDVLLEKNNFCYRWPEHKWIVWNDFRCLQDVMDVYDMSNIVDKPTCFKTENNMLLNVILTSNRKRICSTLNVNTGISDFSQPYCLQFQNACS